MLKSLQKLFKKSFLQYSIVTNTVTGMALFVAGDVVEQKVEIHRGLHKHFDLERMGRVSLVGLVQGPPHIIFYQLLDKHWPSRSMKAISKKILLDQLIACPMFSILYFFPLSLMEGKSIYQSWIEFKTKFPIVYLIDWALWPPCQFINFLLVPPHYRVLFVNTATVFWNVFLSHMKHYDQY